MYYNRQAVSLEALALAEVHRGNGSAHGGSVLADSICYLLSLEFGARVGWIPWHPDAVSVFIELVIAMHDGKSDDCVDGLTAGECSGLW